MNMAVTPPTLIAAKKALDKAKIKLMTTPDSAFVSTLCFSLKHAWDESIPTAATDGRTIWFNPEAYLKLTPGQQLSRLLHETWHPALGHLGRLGSRNPGRWNAACDYFINLMLIDAGFERIPTWLVDEKYRGMSADQIYDLLPEDEQGDPDENDLRPPLTEPEEAALKAEIEDLVVRAAVQSRMQGDKPGTIPGSIQIFLDKLLNPKLPWQTILRKYMNNMNKVDYSWRRPNRRYFPDHHLPSLYSEALIDIAVAVDTSGSVSDEEFHRFVSEVASIFKSHKPKKITLIQFDTSLKAINEVHSLDELKALKFTGRGGTRIKPVIDWVHENKPQLMMIFSDGGFHHYNQSVKSPLLWMIHNNPKFTAPYGKIVHYEV